MRTNKRSEESKVAFDAAICAMRMAMRGDHMDEERIGRITRRAKMIYALSTITVAAQAGAEQRAPGYMEG